MKTAKSIIVVLFVLLTAQIASAYYCPSTGRWLSRDPIGEPGFQTSRMASVVPRSPQLAPSRWINRDSLGAKGDNNFYECANNNLNDHIDAYGLMTDDSVTSAIEGCLKKSPPEAISCLEDLLTTIGDESQANFIRNALNDLKSKMFRCSLMYGSYKKACGEPGCGQDGLPAAEYIKRATAATTCAMLRAAWLKQCACNGFMNGTADSAFWREHWLQVGMAASKAINCWHKAKDAGCGGSIPTLDF